MKTLISEFLFFPFFYWGKLDLKSIICTFYCKVLYNIFCFLFLQPCVFMDPKLSQCSIVNVNDPTALPKTFTFDGVYYTNSTTEQIYNEIAYPLVEVSYQCTVLPTLAKFQISKFIKIWKFDNFWIEMCGEITISAEKNLQEFEFS